MANRIGLRREDKNEWERRVVLSPLDVEELVASGVPVVVESFPRRAYPDADYAAAGAEVTDSVLDCDLVMGVKEMPSSAFRPGGAYMFFSHTIKGQPHNMAMLKDLMAKGCTLLDYELITDDEGRRLIFFSHHAGLVGMVDSLWMLGRRLEARGIATPFLDLEPTHRYPDLDAAKSAVAAVGRRIEAESLPETVRPLTVGILGYGRVGQAAQEILDLLPVEEVDPGDLAAWNQENAGRGDVVAKVVFKEEHLVEAVEADRAFALQDYYDHPEAYRSTFARHLPHLSLVVNAIFWSERYPRFADAQVLRDLFADGPPKLIAVGDITCDVDGSFACTVEETGPGDPVYVYDPATRQITRGMEGEGLPVLAVGNLPCELPVEASAHFGRALRPFVPVLAGADFTAAWEDVDLPGPLRRAVILWKGRLSPHCAYMERFLD
jgi:alpha-aminoadipic semialdehyde synthase